MPPIPGKAKRIAGQEPRAATGCSRGSQEEAAAPWHVGWGRAQARIQLQAKDLPLIQTKQLLSPSAQDLGTSKSRETQQNPTESLVPAILPLPKTPSEAQTAQSGPLPATPAGMGPQGGPVQSLPSVLGVQLTFKGDCKASSIYSGILLPGGVGHGASSVCHRRFPLQPPPWRSYRLIPLTSHPRAGAQE